MHSRAKEISKFLAGVSAGMAVAQFALGQAGALRVSLWGLTITPALIGLLVFLGMALSAHLAYFAWRCDSSSDQSDLDRGNISSAPRLPPNPSRWVG